MPDTRFADLNCERDVADVGFGYPTAFACSWNIPSSRASVTKCFRSKFGISNISLSQWSLHWIKSIQDASCVSKRRNSGEQATSFANTCIFCDNSKIDQMIIHAASWQHLSLVTRQRNFFMVLYTPDRMLSRSDRRVCICNYTTSTVCLLLNFLPIKIS